VEENVAFGCVAAGRKDIAKPVQEMLELVELDDFGTRRPGSCLAAAAARGTGPGADQLTAGAAAR
jgi:ABC-type Fe3+/spermidine/putrescine transport system ATPase subunit